MDESRCRDYQIVISNSLSCLFQIGPNPGMNESFAPGELQDRDECFNLMDKF